jgi:hypothetical protein
MNINGRGIGLRREFAVELSAQPKRPDIDFLEVVIDNWMGVGGESLDMLENLAEKYPFAGHSLSLSIGDGMPVDFDYLTAIRAFLDRFNITVYSDHFSMSRDRLGYLYELLPVPRSKASALYLVEKIKVSQDILSRRLVLENISYYYEEAAQIPEAEFLTEVIERSGCGLLLDVNNIYVNHLNHGIDPIVFMDKLPRDSVSYYHFAGHLNKPGAPYVLDTHGTAVSHEVLALGEYAMARFGRQPIVLERDNHLPDLDSLCDELNSIHQIFDRRAEVVI